MPSVKNTPSPTQIVAQVRKFAKVAPRYRQYARVLQEILRGIERKLAPQAIVQTRAKTVASFAEKIVRKPSLDPVNQFTDLCGGRIITHTQDQVRAVSAFIEAHFEIDWDNSVDVSQRLKPTEFGYRSVHYIVQLKRGVFPSSDIPVKVPDKVYGLKAEIQVRTILEHAWADISHEWVYKKGFQIPDLYTRELAGLAATLEAADRSFSRLQEVMQTYATTYGAYLSPVQMREEIARLEIVLQYDPQNFEQLNRLGMLAVAYGDWDKAISALKDHEKSGRPEVLKPLGVALCQKHKNKPQSRGLQRGRKCLETACERSPHDAEACSTLAGSWKGIDEAKAAELYALAYQKDATDPYPLGNFLERQIRDRGDMSFVPLLAPLLDGAIQKLREQANVGVNLPWAFFDMGKFNLILQRPWESLTAYAKAAQVSSAAFMIETSLKSFRNLKVVQDQLPGYDDAIKLLLLALAVRFQSRTALTELEKNASKKLTAIKTPVVMIVGTTDSPVISALDNLPQGILLNFTTQTNTDRREDDWSDIARILHAWIDLVVDGVDASKVKVLGMGSGNTEALALRISLALGAQVGVIEGSGNASAQLLKDADWNALPNLFRLPSEAVIIREFKQPPTPSLDSGPREILGKAIHDQYLEKRKTTPQQKVASLAPWKELPENLKESNRLQADQISEKLMLIGYGIRKPLGKKARIVKFKRMEIEIMAEREHARWVIERLRDGWTYGPKKDVEKKISPYLAGWAALSEEIKDYDRDTVKRIPEFLAQVGWEVYRISASTT
jgi:ppGpp synthetase/RelA/SpoT-type nucleotidyltranferase